MEVFEWSHDFETGVVAVDEQHHKLVDITNSLGQLLSDDTVDVQALEKVFEELVSYTQYHFSEEENIMERMGIDCRHIEHHKHIHHTFLNDVLELKLECDTNRTTGPKDLFDYLMNWLVYHILGDDMSMSRQMNAIKKGASAATAFEMEKKNKDVQTSMLLRSLNNLFENIYEKNKRLKELNQTLEEKVKERTQELMLANEALNTLATTDALTGLVNRRKAMEVLHLFWEESVKEDSLVSCMMIDADNFKQINDSYGHDAGDIVLKELSKTLTHAVRTDDVVCRLGGDEFFIICPATDEEGVMTIATIVHQKVNALHVKAGGGVWEGSISVGVATKAAWMKDINDLIKQADVAVYASKEAGKNCVKKA